MADRIRLFLIVSTLLWGFGAGAKTIKVKIENMKFDPQTVTVAAGDKVVWTNDDLVPHTVTSDDGSFHSETIAPNQSWKFTAKKKGHFSYKCSFHPVMLGTLDIK